VTGKRREGGERDRGKKERGRRVGNGRKDGEGEVLCPSSLNPLNMF